MKFLFLICSFLIAIPCKSDAAKPWLGSQGALVLLLEWGDTFSDLDVNEIEKVFFGKGNSSLREFFLENSSGKFDLTGEVWNWRRTLTPWDFWNSCDVDFIIEEAWNEFSEDIQIEKYDADRNGKIDNLFIVHSGRINKDRVSPDCVFGYTQRADHAIVLQSQGIGSIGMEIPIGFYLHEAGHWYFWLPDLYGSHLHGKYGIGMWGMMGLGAWGVHNQMKQEDLFRYPAHFEPASKIRIGWGNPRVIQTSEKRVRLRPVETSGDIVVIPIKKGENYYLEYRSARGFSEHHRGHGLLIWKNFTLIQADGRDDLNHGRDLDERPLPPIDENFGDASDPFPGDLKVSSFEDREFNIRIENITITDSAVEVDVIL